MDVSQLCSNNQEERPIASLANGEDSSQSIPQRNPSSLQFILSPYEEEQKNETYNKPNSDLTSMEQILIQCSKLCENIWQLKFRNKTITENERDQMIEELSDSAKSVFKAIQSTKDWVSKDNIKKRVSSNFHNDIDSNNEDLRDEDEEDDYLDDEGEESRKAHATFNDYAEYELIRQARNIQNNQSRSKYRRRNRRNMIGQKCHSCGTTETPEWRRGPDGARTLCNACGLHYSKLLKKGSIAVQTQNYLLTGGSPQLSRSNDAITKALKANGSPFKSIEAQQPPKSVNNFPFIMMDPKYGLVDNTTSSTVPITFDTHTSLSSPPPPQLSPICSRTNNDGFVNSNINNSNNSIDTPSPQRTNSRASISSSSSNSQNSLTPLRIHHWKKNH